MTRTAIVAAFPGELKPLVQGWKHERRRSKVGAHIDLWRWRYDEGEWVAACGGAGQNAATRALAEIERNGPVGSVLSVGWAGALKESYEPGRAYRVFGVVDTLTNGRFRAARFQETAAPAEAEATPKPAMAPQPAAGAPSSEPAGAGPKAPPNYNTWLATCPKVVLSGEKVGLAIDYYADLVDMEAAAVARLAAMRGIAFHCIKGISDGVADRLPDFNRFLTPEGEFKRVGLILFALFHPGFWPALMQMGENSRKASQDMARTVLELLDPQGVIRKRNGYPNLRR